MAVPPTPASSDPYSAANAAGGGANTSGSSSTKDIWGLGTYGSVDIAVASASTPRTGFGGYKNLPRADQEGNTGERPLGGPSMPAPAAAAPGGGITTATSKTADQLMAYYAGLAYHGPAGKAELIDMQQRLYTAGFYGNVKPGEVAFGSWTPASSKAFSDALLTMVQTQQSGSERAPITFAEFVDQAAADKTKSATDNADKQAPTPHQLTNPRVIASVLQQTAQNVLGRNLSKEEVDHFVSDYTATEEEYFKSVDASGVPGANPLTYQPPTPEAAAMDTLSQDHAAEAGGNRASDYLGVLQQLLGQSSLPVGTGPALPDRLA